MADKETKETQMESSFYYKMILVLLLLHFLLVNRTLLLFQPYDTIIDFVPDRELPTEIFKGHGAFFQLSAVITDPNFSFEVSVYQNYGFHVSLSTINFSDFETGCCRSCVH